MYYIYSDEAGTSAKEPVTVVVGIIINADKEWSLALEAINAAIADHVPLILRDGFLFHAKDIWSGYRNHDNNWPRDQRAAFIAAVAAIPRKIKAAIGLGKVRRDWDFPLVPTGIKKHDFDHYMAFNQCIARSNKYVRDWSTSTEVATLIAEDVPSKRKFLKGIFRHEPQIALTPEFVAPTIDDILSGHILQTNTGPVDKIVDTVHFVEKNEAPLLQIADACAFVFRRYFSGQDYGESMLIEMLGNSLFWPDWQGPISNMVFSFNPMRQYPKSD